MSETITVKLQPLTAEAFRPYGHIVDSHHPAYPDVEEGRPAVVCVDLKHQPHAKRVGQLAIPLSWSLARLSILRRASGTAWPRWAGTAGSSVRRERAPRRRGGARAQRRGT